MPQVLDEAAVLDAEAVELDRPASDVLADTTDDDGDDIPLGDMADAGGLGEVHCPRDAAHRFELWETGGPCPRCGTTLIVGREGCCWD